jgi:hypothetical protein
MALSKAEYEQALSQATGDTILLSDADYQRLLKGSKLSETSMRDAKVRGANGGGKTQAYEDLSADAGQPLLAPTQPAEMYRPVVQGPVAGSSSIGRIGYDEAPRDMGNGPAMDVDSAGVGFGLLPKYATAPWKGPDYGSADLAYTASDFGLPDAGDRLTAKAPAGQYEFAPDVVTAKPPAPSSKLDLLARSAFGPPKKKG